MINFHTVFQFPCTIQTIKNFIIRSSTLPTSILITDHNENSLFYFYPFYISINILFLHIQEVVTEEDHKVGQRTHDLGAKIGPLKQHLSI